ncbi:hypothetical protein KAT92_06270 [Candidatus Babeliales bacterium]|nr:hypothetical protein [Candidatus Babeliales bacterium]
MNIYPFIRYVQFTILDKTLHPEFDNDKYLEEVTIDLPEERFTRTISFGYQLHNDEGTFIWIEKSQLTGIVIKDDNEIKRFRR